MPLLFAPRFIAADAELAERAKGRYLPMAPFQRHAACYDSCFSLPHFEKPPCFHLFSVFAGFRRQFSRFRGAAFERQLSPLRRRYCEPRRAACLPPPRHAPFRQQPCFNCLCAISMSFSSATAFDTPLSFRQFRHELRQRRLIL